MKTLAVPLLAVLAVSLGCIGEVDAESPTVSSTGDIVTASLLTPEFAVDTSEFGITAEIILDVKFENPGNQRHGILNLPMMKMG